MASGVQPWNIAKLADRLVEFALGPRPVTPPVPQSVAKPLSDGLQEELLRQRRTRDFDRLFEALRAALAIPEPPPSITHDAPSPPSAPPAVTGTPSPRVNPRDPA